MGGFLIIFNVWKNKLVFFGKFVIYIMVDFY